MFIMILIITVVLVECLIRLPFEKTIKQLLGTGRKAINVLTSTKISDHWKEITLQRYSLDLFKELFRLSFYIITCFIAVFVPIILFNKYIVLDPSFLDRLLSFKGIGTMSILSIIYFNLRKPKKKSDYSSIDKTLHKLALDSNVVKSMTFDFDGFFSKKNIINGRDQHKHVFVCGLARAGTTILMRIIYESGEFRSLTYRDMPFVLMPNAWKLLSGSNKKHIEEKDRAHGDGILVSYDSPEAFEEIFWNTFCHEDYITQEGLMPHRVNDKNLKKFQLYISRILASSTSKKHFRYLSKNNNNILRIPSIVEAFPESTIIIPFRNPLQQAISLLNQHQRFNKLQLKDSFSIKYFKWLGHYEFGLGHLPFIFKDSKKSNSKYKSDDINYWIKLWIDTYTYLLSNKNNNWIFLCFEDLCENPIENLQQMFKKLEIEINYSLLAKQLRPPKIKSIPGVSGEFENDAMKVYSDLKLLKISY